MPDSKFPVKCILVTGSPGTKFDFIAGWLSTLPYAMNNFWHIDPATGKSYNQHHLQGLDIFEINSIELELSNYNYRADADSEYTAVFPLAGHNLHNQISPELLTSGAVKVLNVFFEIENRNNVVWDAMCQGHLADDKLYTIKENQQTDKAKQLMEMFDDFWAFNHASIDEAIILSYNSLFVPGGSRYLCKVLGIEASERHHAYFDTMLPLSRSPDEIFRFGKLWKKSDYIVIDS